MARPPGNVSDTLPSRPQAHYCLGVTGTSIEVSRGDNSPLQDVTINLIYP